jgi:antitoxin Phd
MAISDSQMNWTLAKAKDQLSQLVRRAQSQGPQMVSVRGRDVAVVMSKADYDHLLDPRAPRTLKEAILQLDLDGLDLARDPSPTPDREL